MTHQAQIAAKLEERALKAREEETKYPVIFRTDSDAKALESLAAQFKAGDFDGGLMAELAALLDDEDRREDTTNAIDLSLNRMGDAYDEFDPKRPDDLLDQILVEAGRA